MKIPDIFIPKKSLEDNIKRLSKDPIISHPKYSKFEVINTFNYAKGIAKLKEQGKKPFTFYDNIEARIADYEVNGKGAELFRTWLDSVTGIAYKANSTKFKIILRSDKLENIKPDFNQHSMLVDYDAEQGIELDSRKGKYNKDLTSKEVESHEFWLAAMNNDKEKLAKYVDFWFDKTGKDKGMGVYLRSNTDQDELWALALYNDDGNSYAICTHYLNSDARFVSGA